MTGPRRGPRAVSTVQVDAQRGHIVAGNLVLADTGPYLDAWSYEGAHLDAAGARSLAVALHAWADQADAAREPSQTDADRIIDYGLTICMYGERAPGGDETWARFSAMAEDYLRRRACVQRGFHTPDEPCCPDCKVPAIGCRERS